MIDHDFVDELQAKSIATTISGVNFIDAKESHFEKDVYSIKITETTSYLLKIVK